MLNLLKINIKSMEKYNKIIVAKKEEQKELSEVQIRSIYNMS